MLVVMKEMTSVLLSQNGTTNENILFNNKRSIYFIIGLDDVEGIDKRYRVRFLQSIPSGYQCT